MLSLEDEVKEVETEILFIRKLDGYKNSIAELTAQYIDLRMNTYLDKYGAIQHLKGVYSRRDRLVKRK